MTALEHLRLAASLVLTEAASRLLGLAERVEPPRQTLSPDAADPELDPGDGEDDSSATVPPVSIGPEAQAMLDEYTNRPRLKREPKPKPEPLAGSLAARLKGNQP